MSGSAAWPHGGSAVSSSSPRSWRRALLAVGLLAVLLVAWRTAARENEGDLRVYYDVVPRLAEGLDLYLTREGPDPDRPTGYIYPPLFAVLFLPLTHLPFGALRFLWCAATGLLALRAYERAWLLVRRAPWGEALDPDRHPRRALAAMALGAAASLRFVLSDLGHGQVNLLVVWLALEGVAVAETGRERRGGLCLSLAVLFKLTPAILVLGDLLAGLRRRAAWAVGLGLGLALIPTAVLGVDGHAAAWARFVTQVTPWNARQHAYVGNNAALGSWLQRLLVGEADAGDVPAPLLLALDPDLARGLALAAGLAVLAAAVAWILGSERARRDGALRAAVLFACIPLVSPVAWKPHLVGLILPGLAAGALLARGAWRRPAGWVLIVALLLVAGTTRGLVGRSLSDLAIRWGAVTVGLVLLPAGLIRAAAALERPQAERGTS